MAITEQLKSIKMKSTEDKYTQENLDVINHYLEKLDFYYCGSVWKFRFGYNVDGVVKYDAAEKTVIFKFDKNSPLLKRLVRGRRNGEYDIDVIIIPTIDLFKMAVEDESTTDKVVSALKRLVKRFNEYYNGLN